MAKALVVDDSKTIRNVLERTLREMGYEVRQAEDGRRALEVLESEAGEFSLALVDWNMPVMNGLEFVQAVRSDQRWAGLPLMMVTTETQIEQMRTALEAGANDYVMKPFTDDIIRDKLKLLEIWR